METTPDLSYLEDIEAGSQPLGAPRNCCDVRLAMFGVYRLPWGPMKSTSLACTKYPIINHSEKNLGAFGYSIGHD